MRERVCVCVYARVTKSYPTLCDPTGCSPLGSSVHFPGTNTGVGGHSLLHTAVGQVKNRSVSAGGGRGRGRVRGRGEEQGELGNEASSSAVSSTAHTLHLGRQVTQDRADHGWAPGSSVPASTSQSIAWPVHFGGLCYNDDEGGPLELLTNHQEAFR